MDCIVLLQDITMTHLFTFDLWGPKKSIQTPDKAHLSKLETVVFCAALYSLLMHGTMKLDLKSLIRGRVET